MAEISHSRHGSAASSAVSNDSLLFDDAEHDSGSASELEDGPVPLERRAKDDLSPELGVERSPIPEAVASRVHRLSLDENDGEAPAPKSMRLGSIVVPGAPRIGGISTPIPSISTPQPGATPRPGRRPDMHLDLNGLPGFTISRVSPNSSGSSSNDTARSTLRLPPLRPRLVSRFSSDETVPRTPRTPTTPGIPVTPGTHDALFAFGIGSTVGSPYSLPTPLKTPDGNLWSGYPLGSPVTEAPAFMARTRSLASPVTEMAPALMARSRSLGRSGLSESVCAPASPMMHPSRSMHGHDEARALYHTLLPGAGALPRNSTLVSPAVERPTLPKRAMTTNAVAEPPSYFFGA